MPDMMSDLIPSDASSPGTPDSSPGSRQQRSSWRELAGLSGILVVVMLLWNTLLVYPLKILVVFFHELSHGLAAILTGGSIKRIEMVAQEGGLCVTLGGNGFIITSAGYLGSMVWGGAILLLAARSRHDKKIMSALGTLMLIVAVIYVRPFFSFGFAYCVVSGLAMLAVATLLAPIVNDRLLKTIGLTSCLYAVMDIKSDVLDRPECRSDAWQLAQRTGIPTWFWGILWIAIAVAGTIGFIVLAGRTRESQERT